MFNPTLRLQCWGFAIGSTFFAIGSAPGFAALFGALAANLAYFVGSWFFTSAAAMQLALAGPRAAKADWLSAATQFVGTVLFNLSTGAAVWAHTITRERRLVWTPDATGSAAFLISGVLAVVALSYAAHAHERWATWINLAGCIAFGASALGAFVTRAGATEDAFLATSGTFIGALCFLSAALLLLPKRGR